SSDPHPEREPTATSGWRNQELRLGREWSTGRLRQRGDHLQRRKSRQSLGGLVLPSPLAFHSAATLLDVQPDLASGERPYREGWRVSQGVVRRLAATWDERSLRLITWMWCRLP